MTANIFISYASQDSKVANTLCKALEGRGFKCWIASRDIAPGENFQIAIVRAIRNARIMLLVFTGNSNNSDEMAKELALASQSKLIVVPLRIDDVRPNEAFAYEFATRQWIDFFHDWETAIEQLANRIAAALQTESGIAPVAAPPEPVQPAPTPDVIARALADQPAEAAMAAAPAAATPGPSSFQDAPARRGAPVALFVTLGILMVALIGGAAVLLPAFLAKKPVAPAPVAAANAIPAAPATSLAVTPAPLPNPSLLNQPSTATPGPAPMASAGSGDARPPPPPRPPGAAPVVEQEDPDLDPETHPGPAARYGRSGRHAGGGGGGGGGGGSPDVPF
ncbi:MAG TPA: toll/interleukin-1 receptor domain-containing protein [Caulobacteraceae bacterium]|jgi:uncharacterized membrane protein YgcG|nr:toll/interleukin-1 receptor domain-containing protein [Caulobacteraceae bacterium]